MNISIYSRNEIERLIEGEFPKDTAVISFYTPPGQYASGESVVDYKGKPEKLFQLAIQDIDLEELEDFGLTYDTYFTEVDELAEYIYEIFDTGLNIICQCEYGQSRSAACAAAILEYFEKNGISIFRDYRYYPNKLVFNKIYDALELWQTGLKNQISG